MAFVEKVKYKKPIFYGLGGFKVGEMVCAYRHRYIKSKSTGVVCSYIHQYMIFVDGALKKHGSHDDFSILMDDFYENRNIIIESLGGAIRKYQYIV